MTIPAGTLQTRMYYEDGGSEDGGAADVGPFPVMDDCTVTATLSRDYTGVLDPGYGEGGSMRASQGCSIELASTP